MDEEQRQLLSRMQPFIGKTSLPVVARLSESEFAKARLGFTPKEMEHKWFICYDDPFLMFFRSWSSSCVYRIEFSRQGDDVVVKQALWDPQSTAVDEAQTDYQTEFARFMLLGYLIGRDLKPPSAPSAKAKYQPLHSHHAVGDRPLQVSASARAKPWWKLWRGLTRR